MTTRAGIATRYAKVYVAARVPCQVLGRFSGSGKLGEQGSAWRRCTSRGRFQDSASCGRTVLNSTWYSSP